MIESERHDLKRKKEIYGLVSRSSTNEIPADYRIPEEYDVGRVSKKKRVVVASERYRDNNVELSEEQECEHQQLRKATVNYGSKDKPVISDGYQMVFEDQVEFVKQSVTEGINSEYKLKTKSLDSEKSNNLQEQRKLLPIYSYKEKNGLATYVEWSGQLLEEKDKRELKSVEL